MTWRMAIDVGGTFTDCLAQSPTGNTRILKVLSDGTLRGVLGQKGTERRWAFRNEWGLRSDAFSGFMVQHLKTGKQATVIAYDESAGQLILDEVWSEASSGDYIALSTGEPAPILAARIATSTEPGQSLPPIDFRLGTTRATNALLELKGAKTLLITNQGLEDLLLIGDQARSDLFALAIHKPEPLTRHVYGIKARISKDGEELIPLLPYEIQQVLQVVRDLQPEAIAISLLHAYRFAEHEQKLAKALREAGYPHVSVSHELAPEIRLLPRTLTTVTNAYLSPVFRSYLDQVSKALDSDTFRVMSSAGGLMEARHFPPKDSLLSGPAGGATGAANVGQMYGHAHVLSFDMGGTSTDVARCGDTPQLRYETEIGDQTLLLPSVAIETVAAGGGSICSFDGQKLAVGPESAGASPGPACYGAGGPLTVTDVNLLLGLIDPETFLFPVDTAAARNAAREIALEAGISIEALLSGFRQIADEIMAGAIKRMALRQGHAPSTHALVSFGGAGGQHACAIAELLSIHEVIVPKEASILSAWGIAKAPVSVVKSTPILQWLEESSESFLSQTQESLRSDIREQLAREAGYTHKTVIVWKTVVECRIQGQNHSLALAGIDELAKKFKSLYQSRYGHWMEGRAIECVNMRVTASWHPEAADVSPAEAPDPYPAPSSHRFHQDQPIFDWPSLSPGAEVKGPALISSPTTSISVRPGWVARTTAQQDIRLLHRRETQPKDHDQAFPAELELFSQRFQHIAREMGEMLRRTSLSVNVKERLDYSCALLDADGRLVANAPHVPVHLGSLGICVRKVKETLDPGPGDVVVTNHPGFGGSHLPDVTLIQAVFDKKGSRIGYVVNRAHHAEIGGIRPGSTPPFSKHLAEEGVVISPMLLVRQGEFQEEAILALLSSGPYPSRNPKENLGDLRAALAANHTGAEALKQLVSAEGTHRVQQFMKALMDYSDRRMRAVWRRWEPHNLTATEYLDDGSQLSVSIRQSGEQLHISFAGSSAIHPHNVNATPAIVYSAVLYVLRLLIPEDLPLNEGLLQSVVIELPEGILNPVFSEDPTKAPAVVGGNTETSQRLTDTLLKALGVAACGQGTMNNLLFGNERFGFYETIGGGSGATVGNHGADAVHQHMTNTRLTDPELLEFRYPVRLWQQAIRKESGGHGRWNGGDGMIRKLEFLDNLEVTILAQHRREQPYGLHGGEPGATGRQSIRWPDGREEELPGIVGIDVVPGTILTIETPGGGGAN